MKCPYCGGTTFTVYSYMQVRSTYYSKTGVLPDLGFRHGQVIHHEDAPSYVIEIRCTACYEGSKEPLPLTDDLVRDEPYIRLVQDLFRKLLADRFAFCRAEQPTPQTCAALGYCMLRNLPQQ